jgi:hypothetical protein
MAAARQPFVHLVLPVVVAGSILAASGCGRSPQPEAGPERSASAPPAGQPRRGADDRIADGTNAASDGVPAAPAPLEVPPLPDGTPEQLLQFVADLKTAKIKPKTQEELVGYVNAVCARGLEAADRIMARLPADAPAAIEAGRLKLDSLLTLADFQQDGKAARDAEGFARSLAEGPTPALARLGRRTLILMAAQKAFAAKDFDTIPDIVSSTADLLAADPDDTETAQLAVSLAKATESIESAGRHGPPTGVARQADAGRGHAARRNGVRSRDAEGQGGARRFLGDLVRPLRRGDSQHPRSLREIPRSGLRGAGDQPRRQPGGSRRVPRRAQGPVADPVQRPGF